nr:heterogeneous nuclear ribonucleoprotein A0-like [Aegilops tauschii subsp. strangulata]
MAGRGNPPPTKQGPPPPVIPPARAAQAPGRATLAPGQAAARQQEAPREARPPPAATAQAAGQGRDGVHGRGGFGGGQGRDGAHGRENFGGAGRDYNGDGHRYNRYGQWGDDGYDVYDKGQHRGSASGGGRGSGWYNARGTGRGFQGPPGNFVEGVAGPSNRSRRSRRTVDGGVTGALSPAVFASPRPDAADERRHHLRDALDAPHLPVFFPVAEDHRSRRPLRHRRHAAVCIVAGHHHHPL